MCLDWIETGFFGPRAPLSVQPESLHVVSWNIARGSRFDAISEFLLSANADLILLQESDRSCRRTAYRNVASELAQKLGMQYVFGIAFQELGQGSPGHTAHHGQTTLSRWPLSEARILRFRSQSRFWRPHWWIPQLGAFQRRIGGRMALVTHVAFGNHSLTVYNVHLESRNGDQLRRSQLAELLNDTHQCDSNNQLLVAGDFNFDLTATTSKSSVVHQAGFENPFAAVGLPTIPRSLQGRRAIDWILIRGDAKTRSPEVHDSVAASDHYPLSLTLRL
jgi:endonuclease/exonuclease/phosphatase family metal-dependent hydrolase